MNSVAYSDSVSPCSACPDVIAAASVRRSPTSRSMMRNSPHQSDSAKQSPRKSGCPARIVISIAEISRRQRSMDVDGFY
jgi:hypothetical protein